MDFELSDDQRNLQDAARDLLDDRADSAHVRAHLSADQPYDPVLWKAMVDQGWMGVTVPEERGGLGLGWVEAAVLLEEVGRHTAPAPFLSSLLALETLLGADELMWADRLLSGESVGCVAWSQQGEAITIGAGPSLSGCSNPVIAADTADVAVVWTPTEVFAVDLTAGGSRPSPESAMDATRSLAWLELDHTPATPLGGADAANDLLNRAAVGLAAEMLGGASRVLEMTSQYAKDRIQFGQPIGSFQAVKHRCADMVVDVEGMRSTAWYGAWSLQPGTDRVDASIAASAAKIWCSDAARRVMSSGLQVHGGIGFTWEHDLHLYLKRSHLDQVSFGDAAYHRERLAALLQSKVQAGQSVI